MLHIDAFGVESLAKFDEPGGLWRRDYPLTEAARKTRAAFNPLTDSVAPGCRPKGMPTIMEQPYPIEFVNKGDTIDARSGRALGCGCYGVGGSTVAIPRYIFQDPSG